MAYILKHSRWLPAMAGLLLLFYSVALTCFQHARSPRYIRKADPEYQYLFAALNMARLDPVYYSDHPGSTLLMLGAMFLHTAHLFTSNSSLLDDVLRQPEYFLDAYNAGLVLCYLMVLIVAAWLTLRITAEPFFALAVLLTPLLCFFHFTFALSQVRSESVLFDAGLLLGVCALAMQSSLRRTHPGWLAVSSALAIGFGAATKLAFVPLALFPLLTLPGVRWRALYCLSAPLAFLLFLGPALPTYHLAHRIIPWMRRSGTCGIGQSMWLGSSANVIWREMLHYEQPFFVFLILAAILCGVALAVQYVRRIRPAASTGVLAALLLTITVQTLAAIRAGMANYIISSLALAGVVLVLAAMQLMLLLPPRVAKIATIVLILCWPAWSAMRSLPLVQKNCSYQIAHQAQLVSLHDTFAHDYQEYTQVHYYYYGMLPFALYFGNGFAHHQYAAQLDALYPGMVFWVWDGTAPCFVRGFARQPVSADQLWFENDKIVMAGSSEFIHGTARPPMPLRQVLRADEAGLNVVDCERIWTNELNACHLAATRAGWPALRSRTAHAVFHARFDAVPPGAAAVPARVPHGQSLTLTAPINQPGSAWDVCGFRAANRHLTWPAFSASAAATGDCTLACLIRIGDKPGWQIPFGHGCGNSNTNSPWFFMCANNEREIHFVMQFTATNGAPCELRIGHRLPPHLYLGWHVLAATYSHSDNTIALYVDGACAGTAEPPAGARRITSDVPLTIGSLAGGNLPFLGYIRDVIVFDRALSAGELSVATTAATP